MGYTTDFSGSFDLDRPLKPAHREYLEKFAETRRVKRDAVITELRSDPVREAAGLPIGREGAYFVGEGGDFGQGHGEGILDYNRPPEGQPELWCQWVPTDDGKEIRAVGEKFYEHVEWLEYLIEHFLKRWGYVLNGGVYWQGEGREDMGLIRVVNNVVTARQATITY